VRARSAFGSAFSVRRRASLAGCPAEPITIARGVHRACDHLVLLLARRAQLLGPALGERVALRGPGPIAGREDRLVRPLPVSDASRSLASVVARPARSARR
jgi:hypothetical protein